MKVTFPSSLSEPMGLPNSAASPHTSSMSSRIWKASPSSWAYVSAAAISPPLPPAAATPRRQAPAIMAPVLSRWTSVTSASVFGAWRVSSTWPATMPSAPETSARMRPQAARRLSSSPGAVRIRR